MYGLKHPCTTTCQVFYFSWFLFFFFPFLCFFSVLSFFFYMSTVSFYLFILNFLLQFFFWSFFILFSRLVFFFGSFVFFFSPLICYLFIYQGMKVNLYKLHFLSLNFNLLYLPNIRMYNFTYNKHNHNKCLLVTIRVNYVFAPYTLYHISIWSISFQLC